MAKRRKWIFWLQAREELCSGCDQAYAHGTGSRCVACDAELCTTCTTTDGGENLCTSCREGAAKPARRTSRWRHARSGRA
ncbi:MAG: hypothetical protein WA208_12310 [Thermoanaerobaculia bacterium]